MASRTFEHNGIRYEAAEKMTINGVQGIEWVRWKHQSGAWVRSGNSFEPSGATKSSIAESFGDLIKAKKRGAHAKMEDGKRTNIYLSAESRSIAERIGGGNVSEGIRKALAIADDRS